MLAAFIPFLIPLTIYVKTESVGLAGVALTVISGVEMIDPRLRGLATAGMAVAMAALVYKLLWRPSND
jgi:type II secretory pathway component PulM